MCLILFLSEYVYMYIKQPSLYSSKPADVIFKFDFGVGLYHRNQLYFTFFQLIRFWFGSFSMFLMKALNSHLDS